MAIELFGLLCGFFTGGRGIVFRRLGKIFGNLTGQSFRLQKGCVKAIFPGESGQSSRSISCRSRIPFRLCNLLKTSGASGSEPRDCSVRETKRRISLSESLRNGPRLNSAFLNAFNMYLPLTLQSAESANADCRSSHHARIQYLKFHRRAVPIETGCRQRLPDGLTKKLPCEFQIRSIRSRAIPGLTRSGRVRRAF